MTAATFNLDEIQTDDPVALAAAFEHLSSGEPPEPAAPTPTPEPTEPKPEDPPKANDDPPSNPENPSTTDPATAGQQTGTEAEPAGVATNDGSHIIPYSVLKGARERATRAEEMLREMQQQVEALKQQSQQAGKQPGANNGAAPTEPADGLSEADLNQLREDFPSVYKALMIGQQQIQFLQNRLSPVDGAVRQMAEERAQNATETVQEAIDSVPKLAYIQANDPEKFELAQQFDETLKSNPAWADRSVAERFAKVTEMVEASLGEIKLPGSKPPTATLTPEQMKAAATAKAKADAGKNGASVPLSISEAPAGDPPAQDGLQQVENMSQQELAAMLSKMSPDQMDEFFRNL